VGTGSPLFGMDAVMRSITDAGPAPLRNMATR
jgi:hypothetical protein